MDVDMVKDKAESSLQQLESIKQELSRVCSFTSMTSFNSMFIAVSV